MLDVTPLVAGPWGGVESLRRSLISEVGHDENMVIYQLILKYFNILTTATVIHVHSDHIPALVKFIFSLKWMLRVCSRKRKAAF